MDMCVRQLMDAGGRGVVRDVIVIVYLRQLWEQSLLCANHSTILALHNPTFLRTERTNTTCPIPLRSSFPGGHGGELRGQRGDQDPAQGPHSAKGKLSNNVKNHQPN